MAKHNASVTGTPGTNQTVVTEFYGYSIREDLAAPAVIEFRHGSATGQVLIFLALNAGESFQWEFSKPLDTPNGLYVREVSGSVELIIWHEEGA